MEKYGPWAIALINLIGFIYLVYKDIKRGRKINDLQQIVKALTGNNKLMLKQGEYLRKIDQPFIEFPTGGYMITDDQECYKYDITARIRNGGRRQALNFKYYGFLFEFDKQDGRLGLLKEYKEEIINPIPKSSFKLQVLLSKARNDNEVFLVIRYEYRDPLDNSIHEDIRYFNLPFKGIGKEFSFHNVKINDRDMINDYFQNIK
jgi:hypothetical protein